jgi:hypothetical protein
LAAEVQRYGNLSPSSWLDMDYPDDGGGGSAKHLASASILFGSSPENI